MSTPHRIIYKKIKIKMRAHLLRPLPSLLSHRKGMRRDLPSPCRVKKDGEGPALPVVASKRMGRDLPSPLSRQKGWGGTCPPRFASKVEGRDLPPHCRVEKGWGGTCPPR